MVYLTVVVLLLISSAPAHAYIDPGSGSYLFQIALAGILAIAFSVKMFWRRLRASATRLFTGQSPVETDVTDRKD